MSESAVVVIVNGDINGKCTGFDASTDDGTDKFKPMSRYNRKLTIRVMKDCMIKMEADV